MIQVGPRFARGEAEPLHGHDQDDDPQHDRVVVGVEQTLAHVRDGAAQPGLRAIHARVHAGAVAHEQEGPDLGDVPQAAHGIGHAGAQHVDHVAGEEHGDRQRDLSPRRVERDPAGGETPAQDVGYERLPRRRIDRRERRGHEREDVEGRESQRIGGSQDHHRSDEQVEGEHGGLGHDQQDAPIEAVRKGAPVEAERDHSRSSDGGDQTHEHDPDLFGCVLLNPDDLRDELQRHQHLADDHAREEEPEIPHAERGKHFR